MIDFDALYHSHHRKMVYLAGTFVGSDHAEDVAQIAWRNAWKSRASFAGESAPSTWIYQITKNAAFSWLRSHKRFRTEDPLEAALGVLDERPQPDALLLQRQRSQALNSALRRLPIHTQGYFADLLVGRSYDEMAERAGVPSGTLKSRLHRGRQMLIDRMQ